MFFISFFFSVGILEKRDPSCGGFNQNYCQDSGCSSGNKSNFISCSSFFLVFQEDFKKDNGEELTQVLCKKDPAETGASVCSLLLAQSEVKPRCLLLVLPNRTGKGHICLGGKGGSGAEVRGCWVEIRHRNSESAGAGEQGRADFGERPS